ncbi:MAG TPA: glycoside hydrolase family 2 TIM barrel-domain containing protein, partial [Anseongella sp.]|nr:glycoside hydrolase family 2 TIM barrel-domain containing protein [Anseongella sp.]
GFPQREGRQISLEGEWLFKTDPEGRGEREKWFAIPADGVWTVPGEGAPAGGWEVISVPHTWQVRPPYQDYMGIAWYRKTITVPGNLDETAVRIEFEAVFHSAKVWLNGEYAGEHMRKGYTAFRLNVSQLIRPGENYLAVQVDNRFDDGMLPRNDSYDWAADGGITRPVSLLATPRTYIEHLWVAALPDLDNGTAVLKTKVRVANDLEKDVRAVISYEVLEEKTGRSVLTCKFPGQATLKAGEHTTLSLPDAFLEQALLWHFDQPNLYRILARLSVKGKAVHAREDAFGIRKIEVKNAGFYLNGERVWLAGVERMAGSHPSYGMAEPAAWILHNHEDMKNLNCIFTRVHWQQDKRVLDYCDRHGMLIQVEVPTWGGGTFNGMNNEPRPDIMQNGLEQLREMIEREYNHPSVFSWGLCNEIGGQNPPAYQFASTMLKEAKTLDPYRLCSYASNSLHYTPEKDVSRLMDFIEWNEYYESWLKGDIADMEKTLQAIHRAFPDKPLVIAEYGWCRCTPERKEGDEKLISILKTHNAIFRKYDSVAGLIFFSYNDYRTHIGDKGLGALQQRVHGVVDLYGAKKPSYEVLREESSPVESLEIDFSGKSVRAVLRTRRSIPAYTLRNYRLHWTGYADQDIPQETAFIVLPELKPGDTFTHEFKTVLPAFEKLVAEVFRPTGSSVISTIAR